MSTTCISAGLEEAGPVPGPAAGLRMWKTARMEDAEDCKD